MSNISSSLEVLFSKMENFVSTKTVVGEPMTVGDVIIVPLVDVSFGVGAGSYENKIEKDNKDTSAGGLGAKISPSAVMVIQNGTVQLVNVKNQNSVNKLIDMVPGVLSKLDFSSAFKNGDDDEEKTDTKNNVKFDDKRINE